MDPEKEITDESKEKEVTMPETPEVSETPEVPAENASAPVNDTPAAEEAAAPIPDSSVPAEEAAVPVQEKKSFIRACASWTDIFPIAAMLSVILTMFGWLLSSVLDKYVIPAQQIGMGLLGDEDGVAFLLQYFEFFGIWLAFMLVILLFKSNWPMWKAFLYNGHGNNLKAIPAGILLGFGMNGFCILMSVIMGDIKLSYSGFEPVVFFAFLFCVMIQSGAEEIVDRCYLYQKLRRRYRWPAVAVIVNALVFMSLHMSNPGVTRLGLLQVFLIGILFSLIIYYWDSLWTVIWAHTAWNFSQSIVFGLPNSGIVSKYSVFKLEAASARDGIFYNTSFGVEGSLGANVMIAAVIVIVLIYGLATKRGERMDHWAEAEKRDAGKNHYWEAVILTIIMVAVIVGGYFTVKWVNDHAEEIQQVIEESQQAETAQEAEPAQGPETPVQEGQQAEPAQEPEAPAQEGQQAEPPQEQTAPAQDGQQAEPAQDGQQTAPEEQQAAPAQDDQQAAPEEQQAEPAQEPVQSNL